MGRTRRGPYDLMRRTTDHDLDPCVRLEHLRVDLGLAPRLVRRVDRLSPLGAELLVAQYGLGNEQPLTLEEL